MVANGPVWEVLTVGDDLSAVGKSRECEARIPGALSLLVEVDQVRSMAIQSERVDNSAVNVKTWPLAAEVDL